MNDNHELITREAAVMSRRCFLSTAATVGALTFLGSIFGGRIEAYADEAGNTSFVLYVLSRKQIAVQSVQPSTDTTQPVVVPGASIEIVSLNNGATVKGTTDQTGSIIFNIQRLSMQYDSANPNEDSTVWNFWGKVTVTKDGYRDYVTPKVFLQGGPVCEGDTRQSAASSGSSVNLQVPMQPLGAMDSIYVRMLAFNGYDVQYQSNTFCADETNENIDTLDIEVCTTLGGSSPNIYIAFYADNCGDGNFKVLGSTLTQVKNGVATASLSGQWLKVIRGGSKTAVDVQLQTRAPIRVYPQLTFEQSKDIVGAHDLASGQGSYSLSDSAGGADSYGIESMLFGTNGQFKLNIPGSPINIVSLPSGYVGLVIDISASSKSWDPKEKQFSPWKTKSLANSFGSDWAKDLEEKCGKEFDKTVDLGNKNESPWEGFKNNWAFGCSFKMAFQAMGLGHYEYNPSSAKYGQGTMKLAGKGSFSVEISFTTRFFIGVVPFYIEIKGGIGLYPSINGVWDFNKKCLTPIDSPRSTTLDMIFDLRADLGISIAAGVPGLLALGVRGYAIAEYELHLKYSTADLGGKSNPQKIFKWSAGAEFFWQALLWSGSHVLKEKPLLPAAYDSWRDRNQATMLTSGSNSVVTEKIAAHMVSESELAGRAEFAGVLSSAGFTLKHALKSNITYSNPGTLSRGCANPYLADSSYNPLQGIKPTDQIPVFGDTFADTRPKFVTLPNGDKWVFRLAVVDISVNTNDFQVWQSTPTSTASSTSSKSFFLKPTSAAALQSSTTPSASSPYPHVAGDPSLFSDSEKTSASDRLDASAGKLTETSAASVSRVRLVAQKYNPLTHGYSDPEVIDFYTGYSSRVEDLHVNHHDIDFSVCCGTDNSIYLSICSVVRPTIDDISIEDQAERTYCTLLNFDPNYDSSSALRLQGVTTLYDLYRNSSIPTWNPVLASIPAGDNNAPHIVLATAAKDKDRYGDDVLDLWMHSVSVDIDTTGNPATKSHAKVYSNFISDPDSNIRRDFKFGGKLNVAVCNANKPALVLSWTEDDAINSRMVSDYNIIDVRAGNVIAAHRLVKSNSEPISTYLGQAVPASSWNEYPCFLYGTEVMEQPVNGSSQTEPTMIKTLYRVIIQGNNSFTNSPVAYTNSTKFFVGPNGKSLYSLRMFTAPHDDLWGKNGSAPALSSSATEKRFETISPSSVGTLKSEGVEQYQIMRGHYNARTNSFKDFYPIAQLNNAPDYFAVIKDDFDGGEFLQATVDNSTLAEGKSPTAKYYHVLVPSVVGVQLEEASLASNCVGPNDSCFINVLVSNTGNTRVKYFNVDVAVRVGSETTPSETITIQVDTSNTEPTNTSQFIDERTGEPYDGWQEQEMPMKPKRVLAYSVSFKVPEGWDDGEVRNLDVRVSNPVAQNDELFKGGESKILASPNVEALGSVTAQVTNTSKALTACTLSTKEYGVGEPYKGSWGSESSSVSAYLLTIKYVFEDGAQAAKAYSATLAPGKSFDIDSPVIEGYIADKERVSGSMPSCSTTITVTYAAKVNDDPTGGEGVGGGTSQLPALKQVLTIASSAGSKRGSIVVEWGTVRGKRSNCTGYQVYVRRRAKGAKAKYLRVAGESTAAKIISGLKSGRFYTVKVRMYRKVGKKYSYGKWSKAVKVKAK